MTTNDESVRRMTMAATKRARVDRAMVTEMRVVGNNRARATTRRIALVTRVACDEEGDGDGYKSNGDEGDARATAMRAMVMAMATAKATTWVMVMVTRLAGDKEGKGEGGKGDGDDDEGGARAMERARAARRWRRRQGWRASGRRRRRRGG